MEEKITSILESADLSGFTMLLKGAKLKRYVIAFTDNEVWSIPLLAFQAVFYGTATDNLTIGGRTNLQRQVVVDIGTSTDSLEEARYLQRRYNQQAIRDNVTKREIY